MKRHALLAICAFCLGTVAQAKVVDLASGAGAAPTRNEPVSHLAVTKSHDIVPFPAHMSELPEPEVFLMMLVGLALIGVRAGRGSGDKFR